MTESVGCPGCGNRWPDEYTHSDCPPGSTADDHRHWVCANRECQDEWVESAAAMAVTPEEGGR
jgi:hypothetical protein